MLTTAGNENTYQFLASFMLFPHFMLKVFTFFALFLEFKLLHETSISKSACPHSYNAFLQCLERAGGQDAGDKKSCAKYSA